MQRASGAVLVPLRARSHIQGCRLLLLAGLAAALRAAPRLSLLCRVLLLCRLGGGLPPGGHDAAAATLHLLMALQEALLLAVQATLCLPVKLVAAGTRPGAPPVELWPPREPSSGALRRRSQRAVLLCAAGAGGVCQAVPACGRGRQAHGEA